MKEPELLKRIQLIATEMGARLFRNNIGKGWIGKSVIINSSQQVYVNPGDVVIRNARRFHAGLGKGSCDLIGWTPVIITEEMVGQKFAIFTGVEGKTGRLKATAEQNDFIHTVNNSGGRAVIIRDNPELIRSEIENIKNTAGGLY